MCEKLSQDRAESANAGGDLVRRLLLTVPTDRSRSVASFSAPDFGTLARPPTSGDVPTDDLRWTPVESCKSSVPKQQQQQGLPWHRWDAPDGRPYGPVNGDPTQNRTSSCPTTNVGVDRVTRQQINEFEDLIEKIDQLNGTPIGSGPSRAKRPGVSPKCAPFGLARPPPIQRTSQGSIDDDLEVLLQQNPSLLDPPSYDCDSGIDVSPVTRRFAPVTPQTSAPAQMDLDDDDHVSVATDGNRGWTGMALAPVSPGTDKNALTSPKVDRPFDVSPEQHFGHLTSTTPVNQYIGPPTSVKTATMTTRTNLKQILQMQQVRDEERKEQEKAKMKTLGTTGVQGSLTNTSAVTVPMTTSLAPRVDVPREVLKVESRLENPTRYHVMENKKRQLQEYLSTAQGTGRSLLAQSVPSDAIGPATTPASTAAVISAAQQHLSSSAPSPDSPNSVALSSSAASEADVIDSIIQMESSMDTDNSNFLQTSTVPDHTNYLEVLKFAPSPAGAKSCPPAVAIKQEFVALTADPQLQALAKDRQKKDNHNMIERRRRYKINDHIKELATLLPKSSDPFFDVIRADRQNKGNILKASVDFIRELKKEVEHLRIESNDIKKLQQENWKLRLQNQQLLNVHNQSASSGAGSPDVSYLLQTTSEAALRVKQEPFEPVVEHHHQQHHHHLSDAALDDFMEDDQHPVNGDPMLPSPMVNDNILLNDEMDFIS